MLQAIIQGIGLGLLMCVLVGPVFFALMWVAVHYNKRSAIWFAIGTAISDFIYAGIVFATVGTFSLSEETRFWMGIVGWAIFALMGVVMIRKTLQHEKEEKAQLHLKAHPHRFQFFGQGFIVNALNPSVVVFRAGAVSAAATALSEKYHIFVMILTTLLVFFSTDVIKILLAEKIKKTITKKSLHRLHMITGVLLILLGLFVFLKSFFPETLTFSL